ncbi:VanZ family protein [Bosea sp. RAF48]|uniref:VanZ family protein n=1 Tax=Bosea sp. RAF48 TaxID=3237480 RepID=UPI003F8EB445
MRSLSRILADFRASALPPFLERFRQAALILGWIALAAIVFATLSPIELRPHIPGLQPDSERLLAYFAASALLIFAYPRKRLVVLSAIVLIAFGLEWLQTLEATRHGRPHDAIVKAIGAVTGACLAMLCERALRCFGLPR